MSKTFIKAECSWRCPQISHFKFWVKPFSKGLEKKMQRILNSTVFVAIDCNSSLGAFCKKPSKTSYGLS